jgi:hypothetical protein
LRIPLSLSAWAWAWRSMNRSRNAWFSSDNIITLSACADLCRNLVKIDSKT